jgi:hypothetical protein
MRIINKKGYNYHTEPLFKESKVLTVRDQHKFNILNFMQQIKTMKVPESFRKLEYFTPPLRPTRQINTNLANRKRARTKFTSLLPLHKFPQTWNDINSNLRNIDSTASFKRVLRSHFLDKYSETVRCDNARYRQCFPV